MTNFIAMFSVVVKNYEGLNDEVTDFAELGELRNLDKKTLQRLEDISKLPAEDCNNIDNLIKAAKLKVI